MRKNRISHEDYKKCLFNETDMCHSQTRIGQKEHQLHTIETKKTSLSPFNDKRYKTKKNYLFSFIHVFRWISKNEEGKFEYYSFGHKKLRKEIECCM